MIMIMKPTFLADMARDDDDDAANLSKETGHKMIMKIQQIFPGGQGTG